MYYSSIYAGVTTRHPQENYDETATSTDTIQRVDQVIVFNYLRPIDSMLLRSYAHMYILSVDIRDIERPKVDICLLKSVEQLPLRYSVQKFRGTQELDQLPDTIMGELQWKIYRCI